MGILFVRATRSRGVIIGVGGGGTVKNYTLKAGSEGYDIVV